ncbi:MAG: PH domain-containing protein [Candidatus Buchananbacteria bacterium]
MSNKFVYKNLALQPGEKIVKIVRQTNLKLYRQLILPIVVIALAFFFLYPLFFWGKKGIAIFVLALTIGLILGLRNFLIWYLKIFIITNFRIIDIDKQNLLKKTVSEVGLDKITDIFYQAKGVSQTLTRQGNLEIILPDKKTKLEFRNVAFPEQLQSLILQLKADFQSERINLSQLNSEGIMDLLRKIKRKIGREQLEEFSNRILAEKIDEL